MLASMQRWLWLAGGLVSLALGAAGAVLPLLPTTPFVLLAAFCFARSSRRLHDWLLRHRLFGPLIDAWQRERAIPQRAKLAAYVSMAVVLLISIALSVPVHVIAIQAAVLLASAVFIATRPTLRR